IVALPIVDVYTCRRRGGSGKEIIVGENVHAIRNHRRWLPSCGDGRLVVVITQYVPRLVRDHGKAGRVTAGSNGWEGKNGGAEHPYTVVVRGRPTVGTLHGEEEYYATVRVVGWVKQCVGGVHAPRVHVPFQEVAHIDVEQIHPFLLTPVVETAAAVIEI